MHFAAERELRILYDKTMGIAMNWNADLENDMSYSQMEEYGFELSVFVCVSNGTKLPTERKIHWKYM